MRDDGMQVSGKSFSGSNVSSPFGGNEKSAAQKAGEELFKFFSEAFGMQTNTNNDSGTSSSFQA